METETDKTKGKQTTPTSSDVENVAKNGEASETTTVPLGGDFSDKWETMTWDTQNEAYGHFYPEWPRTYMVRPHSPPIGNNIRNKEHTTSHEYGNWFQTPPQGSQRGIHPYARYTVPFERRMATPRTPQPISGSLLPPIKKPSKGPPSEQSFKTEPKLVLPDVKAVDVQFLTSQNTLVSIAPSATGVYKYTYPKGINNVSLPDIKEVNLKFLMRNNKTITMRAKPQHDDV